MYDVKPVTSPRTTDCGATCMVMLLDYYGTEVSLEDMIRECNTTIAGCTGADLMRVGRDHGMDMLAYQMDADEVRRQDRPSIVWWKYTHWCICCGMDEDGNVVICNPDKGRYRMSPAQFKGFYSGVALFNGEPGDL